jgi:hypothetical protein
MTAQLKSSPTYQDTLWVRMQTSLEASQSDPMEIVGYNSHGGTFHGSCLISIMCLGTTQTRSVEYVLDEEAELLGIDRQDETGFVSEAFPHRVRRCDLPHQLDTCKLCGNPLGEDPL